jgi:hypothetical protein
MPGARADISVQLAPVPSGGMRGAAPGACDSVLVGARRF